MPNRREDMACAKVVGFVLVTRGYNRDTNDYDGATLILDLETKQWRQVGGMTWA